MKIESYIKAKLPLLRRRGIENGVNEIRYILMETLKLSLGDQIFNKDFIIQERQIYELDKILAERIKGKPLSKIFNKAFFRDVHLIVNKYTFSPRIDSEVLIDVIIDNDIKADRILELGTGTGALSISLLKHFKSAYSIATDISKEAIYIAKKNAILNNVYNRMQFICCDWLNGINHLNFDILISNPPYIKRSDILNLDQEVRNHDPLKALDGGHDGLTAYRNILDSIKNIKKKNLVILFEIGFNQAMDLKSMMSEIGLKDIKIFNDYCNVPRCILGTI